MFAAARIVRSRRPTLHWDARMMPIPASQQLNNRFPISGQTWIAILFKIPQPLISGMTATNLRPKQKRHSTS